jgi:prepilin-type N-terminal cleavage/methylation domain-containing protein
MSEFRSWVKDAGFTLIELLIVLAIIGIFGLIAFSGR